METKTKCLSRAMFRSRFSSDEAKQHLAFLFGQFNVEELRDIRQALSDRIDGQREQAAGRAENAEGLATV